MSDSTELAEVSSLRHWCAFCGLAPEFDRQLGDANRMFLDLLCHFFRRGFRTRRELLNVERINPHEISMSCPDRGTRPSISPSAIVIPTLNAARRCRSLAARPSRQFKHCPGDIK